MAQERQGDAKKPPVIVTMISCVQREEARSLTIPQLERFGLRPHLFLSPCDPAGPEQNNLVSREAVRTALEHDDDLLFTEDDIDFSPAFPDRLAEATGVTYFYLNDRPERLFTTYGYEIAPKILHKEEITPGLYEAKSYKHLFGAQCVFLPKRILKHVLNFLIAHPMQPFDGSLSLLLKKRKEPVTIALPHPVQHRHDRTARVPDDRIKRSMSYR